MKDIYVIQYGNELEYLSAITFGVTQEDDALLQLTEELTECAQAILKYLRAKKGSNPTPVDIEKASWNIKEEFTDVILCSDVCCLKEDLVYFLQKKLSDKDVELKQANNTIFYLIRALKNKDVSKREIDYLCDLGKYNLPISVIMEIINKKDMGFEDGIEQFRKYKD